MTSENYEGSANRVRPAMSKKPSENRRRQYPYGSAAVFADHDPIEAFKKISIVRDLLVQREVPQHAGRALKFVGDQFANIYAADRDNWVTTARVFGYPAHIMAKLVAEKMHDLGHYLGQRDGGRVEEIRDFLKREAVVEMLETCLDYGRGKESPEEENWAYVAWSWDNINTIPVGAKYGTLPGILEGLTAEQTQKAKFHGALAAWMVYDVDFASVSITEAMEGIGNKKGFYNASLKEARRRVEEVLISTNNLVVSPWHVDDENVFARLEFGPGGESKTVDTGAALKI